MTPSADGYTSPPPAAEPPLEGKPLGESEAGMWVVDAGRRGRRPPQGECDAARKVADADDQWSPLQGECEAVDGIADAGRRGRRPLQQRSAQPRTGPLQGGAKPRSGSWIAAGASRPPYGYERSRGVGRGCGRPMVAPTRRVRSRGGCRGRVRFYEQFDNGGCDREAPRAVGGTARPCL